MHPALSVIFFTVASGIGYGFFTVLAVAGMFSILYQQLLVEGSIIALILITGGLASSTFHLANRKNAWRAVFRFKSSWLSREGVLAILFYPIAIAYIALAYWGYAIPANWIWTIASVLVVLFAVATVFSTGMIYACLKTIRQWDTSLVPANYLLIAAMHGQLLILALDSLYTGVISVQSAQFGLLLLTVCLVTKAVYYAWITKPKGSTINTATGFTSGTVRLLDVGHTAGNFLTEEFGYHLPDSRRSILRISVFVFAFIIPLVILGGVLGSYFLSQCVFIALASSLLGVFIERWLFFAEASHVINLYHGKAHT